MDCFASSMIAWKLSERLYKMNVVRRCFQMHCDVTRRSLWLRMIHQLWIFPPNRVHSAFGTEHITYNMLKKTVPWNYIFFLVWSFLVPHGIWVTQCFSSKITAVLLQVLKWLYMVLLRRHMACVGNIKAVRFSVKDKESKVKRHESRGVPREEGVKRRAKLRNFGKLGSKPWGRRRKTTRGERETCTIFQVKFIIPPFPGKCG